MIRKVTFIASALLSAGNKIEALICSTYQQFVGRLMSVMEFERLFFNCTNKIITLPTK